MPEAYLTCKIIRVPAVYNNESSFPIFLHFITLNNFLYLFLNKIVAIEGYDLNFVLYIQFY